MRKQWDAVLLDFDGTLIDSAPDIIAALNLLLGELGHAAVNYDEYRNRAGDGARHLLDQVLEGRGIGFPTKCRPWSTVCWRIITRS